MSKIICSLEEWDSIINYNRPNGSSKTWYVKELKRLSRPLMWADWNIFSEQGDMFDGDMFKNLVATNYFNNIEYREEKDIKNETHLYTINVFNPNYFIENEDIGFSCVSEKYLQDIKEGKSKILLVFPYEGYSGIENNRDFEIIESWRIKMGLPIDSIFYISGNLLCQEIVKKLGYGYQARPVHYFEPWNKYNDNNYVEFKPIDDKYLFLSYNRQPRHHRIILAVELLKNKLFNKGLISLNNFFIHQNDIKEDVEHYNYLMDNTPFVIDSKYGLDYNLAINITKKDYEKTFISLITETLVDNGTLFFSEKIWKPIMVGHPFILYGCQGSLKYLKSLGYKTFDRWIDESYDDEPERNNRCRMIVNELNKFSTKPIDELHLIRKEMNEICAHNQAQFKINYLKKYGGNESNLEIRNIFNEVWKSLKGNENKEIKQNLI
jgi:hypothetical protein